MNLTQSFSPHLFDALFILAILDFSSGWIVIIISQVRKMVVKINL